MVLLQVPNGAISAKAKAVEAARKMQASIIDAANKEGSDPPKYVLIEVIGRGSFGVVYKGYKDHQKAPHLQQFCLWPPVANSPSCPQERCEHDRRGSC